ncbi:MAG: cation:proton antiporter [Thermomicrobiales bacterium]
MLASRLRRRETPLSFPMIFMGIGVLIGDRGLGLIDIDSHDPTLEVLGIVTLSLVLFLDALNLRLEEFGNEWLLPVLALGPGTFLTIAMTAAGSVWLFGFSWSIALMIGAILASTDPVVLREVVRDRRIPGSVRRSLTAEAGTNDLVVLPAVLILAAIGSGETGGVGGWVEFLSRLLILSPILGAIIGAAGATAMAWIDRRHGIRTEYQALYGIGLVLAAYGSVDAVGGDGFLAAFAAGFAVTLLNVDMCDCFLDYGETTSEMAMLLSFVLFGAVVSDLVGNLDLWPTLVFAGLVIFIARPLAMNLVLSRARISGVARGFISWFGPRGLNSLLLALLVVQAGLEQGEEVLALTGAVVGISVVLHGCSATPLAAWYDRRTQSVVLEEERSGTASDLFVEPADDVPLIGVDELALLLKSGTPPIVLDVRTRSQFNRDMTEIPGSIRVESGDIVDWIHDQDRKQMVIAYCT